MLNDNVPDMQANYEQAVQSGYGMPDYGMPSFVDPSTKKTPLVSLKGGEYLDSGYLVTGDDDSFGFDDGDSSSVAVQKKPSTDFFAGVAKSVEMRREGAYRDVSSDASTDTMQLLGTTNSQNSADESEGVLIYYLSSPHTPHSSFLFRSIGALLSTSASLIFLPDFKHTLSAIVIIVLAQFFNLPPTSHNMLLNLPSPPRR